MHGANDERDVSVPIIGAKADITLIDGTLKLISNTVAHLPIR